MLSIAYILMSNAIFGNVGDFADDVEDSNLMNLNDRIMNLTTHLVPRISHVHAAYMVKHFLPNAVSVPLQYDTISIWAIFELDINPKCNVKLLFWGWDVKIRNFEISCFSAMDIEGC